MVYQVYLFAPVANKLMVSNFNSNQVTNQYDILKLWNNARPYQTAFLYTGFGAMRALQYLFKKSSRFI